MGCNISTHPRVIPQHPEIKVDRLKSLSPSSPTSANSKTTSNSPHHDSQPRPQSSGASNPASQNWSGVTFGALDVAKDDYSWRNMRSPSIGLRLSGDLTRRKDSPDPSPLLDPHHQNQQPFYELTPVITFSGDSPALNQINHTNHITRRSERFLTVTKKSEFFNEMMSNSNSRGLLKLNTCGGALPEGLLIEKAGDIDDAKPFPRSMDDIQTCTNLNVGTEQEFRPGTPGFKPASSHISSQLVEDEPQELPAASMEQEKQSALQFKASKEREQGNNEENGLNKGREGSQTYQKDKGIRTTDNNKVQLGKMFTQNLLDLVSPKKQKQSQEPAKGHKRTESANAGYVGSSQGEKLNKRNSTEFGDDLSLSLISNIQVAFENKKGTADDRENNKGSVPRKSKVGPLNGLNKIGLFGNDEMISPINNNARQEENPGYVTPPFLNQTSFMKHIFGEGCLEEKVNTNNENPSRAEFERYSFLADVKEEQNDVSVKPVKLISSTNKKFKPIISTHAECVCWVKKKNDIL